MKVYELINELSKYPAGANVEFARLMTLAEFTSCPVVDDGDEEANLYRVGATVCEVDAFDEKRVVLYA